VIFFAGGNYWFYSWFYNTQPAINVSLEMRKKLCNPEARSVKWRKMGLTGLHDSQARVLSLFLL